MKQDDIMKLTQLKKTTMETLLLKMMLSWAILIIGFVALFAGCNTPSTSNQNAGNGFKEEDEHSIHDTTMKTVPDNTRTDGLKQKHADTVEHR